MTLKNKVTLFGGRYRGGPDCPRDVHGRNERGLNH